jgi:OmpA-OmpF porin, OOP family
MKMVAKVLLLIYIVLFPIRIVLAEQSSGKNYPDGHGGSVFFPLGDISFADEVVSFKKGTPHAKPVDSNPNEALGLPNYDKAKDKRFVTLGCRGVLTLRFVDNVLVDTDGPDLYIFEIGPDIEPTKLSISKDGIQWVDVGKIEGAVAAVDISSVAGPEETFSYVRLEDLGEACGSEWPGADIDAVGAIGAGVKITLKSAVLFDFNKSELKSGATEILREVVEKVKVHGNTRVIIEGHTDSIGSTTYNQKLSEERAEAVKKFFMEVGGISGETIKTIGYGKNRPIASNNTEEGRAINRRVELLILK